MRKRRILLPLAAVFMVVLVAAGVWTWRAGQQAGELFNAYYFPGEAPADGRAQEGPGFFETILLELQGEPLHRISNLLEDPWDLACFVPPYYDLQRNPKLAGVAIPWIANDGFNTIVIRRDGVDDFQKVSRGDVVRFELFGLAEGEICYESTRLSLRARKGEGAPVIGVMPGS